MNKKIQKDYSKKWGLDEQVIFTIFTMIRDVNGKYGKVSRTLISFNIKIPARQLKYFYRKVKLYERMDIEHKGKPKNYSELLKNKT